MELDDEEWEQIKAVLSAAREAIKYEFRPENTTHHCTMDQLRNAIVAWDS